MKNKGYKMLLSKCLLLVLSCGIMVGLGATVINEQTLRGFQTGADGELTARVEGAANKFDVACKFTEVYSPGWYKLTAEYRTAGLKPMDILMADIDGKLESKPVQQIPPLSDWSPLTIYFKVKESSTAGIRFYIPKAVNAGTEIKIKNLRVEKTGTGDHCNFLTNADFSRGVPGEMPPGWHWQYNGNEGDYTLIKDSTFKSGERTICIKSDGNKSRTLSTFKAPLFDSGEMNFELWARSDSPNMTIELFLLGNDYKWQVKKAFPVSGEWQKYSIALKCPNPIKVPYCWGRIDVQGAGDVKFSGASLTWTADSATAEPATVVAGRDTASRLPGFGRNLLGNSGFELGMNNWMLDFFAPASCQMAATIASAPECRIIPGVGVDGTCAFFLADQYTAVFSGCIPLQEGSKYTLSAYVKATDKEAGVKMFMLDPGWKSYVKEIKSISTENWTRIALSCVWEKNSKQKKIYVRFDGRNVLIDQIQLELGDLTDYQLPETEIGFVTASDNIFIQHKEPAEMTLKIVRKNQMQQKLRIDLSVRDSWGKKVWEQTVTVDPSSPVTVLPVKLTNSKLGVFELEAKASDDQGRLISIGQSRYAVIMPPVPEPPGLPLFGVCYETCYLPQWIIKQEIPLMRMMGTGINRFFLKNQAWQSLPPENYIDSIRQRCEVEIQGGLKDLMACFNNIPKDIIERVLNDDVIDGQTLKRYGEYLKSVVVPLQHQIKYWEITNEPNLWRHREGPRKGEKTMPPAKYVQLLQTAYLAIKEVNPQLQVVGVCLNGNDFAYLEEIMKLGAGKYMDIFSFHSYRASPDLPDVYNDLCAYQKILDRYDFHGPMINTEQYYAANKFIMHGSDEESSRDYYLPDREELQSCARTVRNYIYHAAAGVPYCAYSPQLTLFRYGGYDRYYLYYAFAAYSAANRFLNSAGKGYPLEAGSALKIFIFPDAAGGPLLTVNAINQEHNGRMKMNGYLAAYDMMGNQFTQEEIAQGLPISSAPVYIRFKPGCQENEIINAIRDADILGMGEAFKIDMVLITGKKLSVTVTNRLNKNVSGKVVIPELPKSWQLDRNTAGFADLNPGKSIKIDFHGNFILDDNSSYMVPAVVSSNDVFVKKTFKLSPVLVGKLDRIKVDGLLDEWQNAHWIALGEENLTGKPDALHSYNGIKDLSAQVAVGWNKDYFAVAVKVKDDIVCNPDSPANAWNYDSLQIYFDQLNNATESDTGFNGDDIVYAISMVGGKPQAWIEKGCEGRYIGEANQATGLDREVELQIARKDGETIYEIKFPRQCLPMVKFAEGETVGFAIRINDNDGKGRKIGLTMTPKGTEPHRKPYLFRDLYFN